MDPQQDFRERLHIKCIRYIISQVPVGKQGSYVAKKFHSDVHNALQEIWNKIHFIDTKLLNYSQIFLTLLKRWGVTIEIFGPTLRLIDCQIEKYLKQSYTFFSKNKCSKFMTFPRQVAMSSKRPATFKIINTLNLKESILKTVIWKCFLCQSLANNNNAY